jgi:deazaflavin-dependent oxidoreductase (nitroreductase family)
MSQRAFGSGPSTLITTQANTADMPAGSTMTTANLDQSVLDALARQGVTQIDITTTGRKTGQPHRIEIVFHSIDGHIYISGMPGFKRSYMANLAADPHFTFHLKGPVKADLAATARIISDEPERRTVLTAVARNWGRDDIDVMVATSPLFEATIEGPAD